MEANGGTLFFVAIEQWTIQNVVEAVSEKTQAIPYSELTTEPTLRELRHHDADPQQKDSCLAHRQPSGNRDSEEKGKEVIYYCSE